LSIPGSGTYNSAMPVSHRFRVLMLKALSSIGVSAVVLWLL
jgi:hypothetical protein